MKKSDSFEMDPVLKKAREDSNFRAIKNLVETENNIRIAQNRIRILQIHDTKNSLKLHNQLGLLNKIQQARDYSNEHNMSVQLTQQKMQEQHDSSRLRLIQKNKEHKQRLKELHGDIKKTKQQRYLTTQEKSYEAQDYIAKSKDKEIRQKQLIRQKIAFEGDQARRNLINYHQIRQDRIKEAKLSEIKQARNQQEIKKQQLKDLSNLQMQLIQKQSQSQMEYHQIKHKLDSLLSTVKMQKKESKSSLKPSPHLRGRQNWN